jgi:hypothetical protein
MSYFIKGDRVRISKGSKYYAAGVKDEYNPIDVTGTVYNVYQHTSETVGCYQVEWDNGKRNGYGEGDLYLYRGENKFERQKQNKLTVREEFLLEAHKAACADWKLKIEKEFPSLFRSKLESYFESFGDIVYDSGSATYRAKIVKDRGCDYVLVPLPNGNTKWTLTAWDYSKRFIENAPSWIIVNPVHNIDLGEQEFTVVYDWSNGDGKHTSTTETNYIVLLILIKK